MATSHGPPLFPQPPASAPPAIPVPGVASSYLPVKSPAQGSGHPSQELRLRITPTQTQSSPYEPFPSRNLSGYPSADPPIPAFLRPQPAFPARQGVVIPMPTAHFDPPPPRRNLTMPIPVRNDTHVSPGTYASYALQAPITPNYASQFRAAQIHPDRQRDQDNSDHEEDGDNSDISTLYDGGTLAKSPFTRASGRSFNGDPTLGDRREQGPVRAQTLATPSLLAAGINGPPNSPPSSPPKNLLSRIRKLVNRRHQPPNQTEAPTTVQLPQPAQPATFPCRLCQNSFAGESSTRFRGFCCGKHMWTAIKRGVATNCPRCKQRACPEGQAFCSASCANV